MDWNELKKDRWIVAVSGGPDSMALLSMAYEKGLDITAAHVNYEKRPTAGRDERTIIEYCLSRNIPYNVLKPVQDGKGNFQAWAREVRYCFFKETADSVKAAGVLVAHQQEDVLETWKMQKERKGINSWYGIREEAEIYGIRVIRPLLDVSKKELIAYCEAKGVPFHHDESNFENHYRRNQIRHEWLDSLSESERQKYIRIIKKENKLAQEKDAKLEILARNNKIELNSYLTLEPIERVRFLDRWLAKNQVVSICRSSLKDWDRQLHNQGNLEIKVSQDRKLVKMYGWLEIIPINDVSYCYVLDKIELFETPWFKIKTEGKTVEAVTLKETDWPLTLRSPKPGDAIVLRFGTKKLNRWFIDRKISREMRESWPVLLNGNGEVILIPGIGSDIEHYSNNPTLYVVK